MNRAVFVVDMATCTGCYACSVACKDRAGLPDALDLLRVETYETGVYPGTGLYFRVIHCFHCAEPACVEACPSQGISQGEDGLVTIDEEACNGCEECAAACPFDAIVLRPDGTAAVCDACADEVARGWDPTCVRACPTRALWYGPADAVPFGNRVPDADFEDEGIGPAVLFLRRHKAFEKPEGDDPCV